MPTNKYSTGESVNKKEINASIKDFKSEDGRVTATSIATFLMDSGWDDASVAAVIKGVLDVEKDEKQMSYLRRTLARQGLISISVDTPAKKGKGKAAAKKKAPAKKKAVKEKAAEKKEKKAPAKKKAATKKPAEKKAPAKKKAATKKPAAKKAKKVKAEKPVDDTPDNDDGDIFD